jgi:hypothetical protein
VLLSGERRLRALRLLVEQDNASRRKAAAHRLIDCRSAVQVVRT